MKNKSIEYRAGAASLKSNPLEGVLEGYPIVFNQKTTIGNMFTEDIDEHALDNTDLSDVLLIAQHDDGMIPIARHRRGKRSTMDLNVDEKGLHFDTKVDIELNPRAKEICSAVNREDLTDMSFAFTIEDEEWTGLDTCLPHRRIKSIKKVYEISVVNHGAYEQTSISARSAATLENEKRALDNARAAALENEKNKQNLAFEKEKYLYLRSLKK